MSEDDNGGAPRGRDAMTPGTGSPAPRLTFSAHLLSRPDTLSSWSAHRNKVVALAEAPPPMTHEGMDTGAPSVRFARAAEARGWFGAAIDPVAFTWTLKDSSGTYLAVSASAFPAIMMAEHDARRVQEFAEQLDLRFAEDAEAATTAWCAWQDGIAIMTGTTWHTTRAEAVKVATAAVGLLPIAVVATYPVPAGGPDQQRAMALGTGLGRAVGDPRGPAT